MKRKRIRISLGLCLTLTLVNTQAGEREDLENLRNTTVNLIRELVNEGILPQDKADAMLRAAEKTPADLTEPVDAATTSAAEAGPEAGGAKVVRVPYVPEFVKDQIREDIKREVLTQARSERWGEPGALPDWISRLSWDGDLRVRYQRDQFQDTNIPALDDPFNLATGGLDNTTEDRGRLRIRARLGLQAQLTDHLMAGFRFTTGNLTDPVSTNQTLGNTFNRYQLVVDRAFLNFDNKDWLSVSAGRIPNPWFSTDLVWDDDLNFEGVAATFQRELPGNLDSFLTLGVFPLQEIAISNDDKFLYGAQGGVQWKNRAGNALKLGLAYYDYSNVTGETIPLGGLAAFNTSSPQFRQKGNSLFDINILNNTGTDPVYALASDFKELNLTAALDLANFDPLHVVLSGDYVRNLGFDADEVEARTGVSIDPQIEGYQARVTVGYPEIIKPNYWQVFLAYKYLERDAVLDAFTDSDFRLGGTNSRGYILGGSYGIAKNTWATLRWLSADEIDGPPLAIDVLQVDLNARF